MKNLVLSMLAIASITAMNSCSSENDPIDEAINAGNQEKVEIKLNAGVVSVETKAAVTAWSDTKVSFAIKGATAYEANTWFAKIATDNSVSFIKSSSDETEDHKYYNTDGTSTTLVGFYPASEVTSGSVSFTIPETGDMDIMATKEFSGSKDNVIKNSDIVFNHQLSKIAFSVEKKDGYTGDLTIKKITLKGTKRSVTLTLPSTISFATNAEGDDITVRSTDLLMDGSLQEAGTVMVQPGQTMTVDITVGSDATPTFTNVPIKITGDASTEVGKAYAITLSFNGKEVESLAATIAPWGSETNGSGDIY